MRVLRGALGALLWVVAGLVGLVSLLLCVTVILLPLGIPLFRASKALFAKALRLMMPRAVAHPIKETRRKGRRLAPDSPDISGKLAKAGKKTRKKANKKVKRVAGRRSKLLG